MVTHVKASIFNIRHHANLTTLCSSNLITALLASTEPKGFKSAAKNPTWIAVTVKKYELYRIIKLGFWSLVLPTPILWALNGCSEPNIILIALLTDSKHVFSQRVMRSFQCSSASATLIVYSDADWADCPDTHRSTSG
ncbi:hypothetical protein BDE02_04G150000 [Populus trichocarpa]|nr:hypothetical protein BDE02_04G150000 [Populus trichocarpa]